jgi:hypothetical protein
LQVGAAEPVRADAARTLSARRTGSRRVRLDLATVDSFLPWSRPRGVAAPLGPILYVPCIVAYLIPFCQRFVQIWTGQECIINHLIRRSRDPFGDIYEQATAGTDKDGC